MFRRGLSTNSPSRAGSSEPGYCFQFGDATRSLIRDVLNQFRIDEQIRSGVLSELFGCSVELLGEDDVRPERLRDALNANAELLEQIGDKLYPYMFPILAANIPMTVREQWEEGFVTVVRLPLDRMDAFETATQALRKLGAHHLLFLTRLSELQVLDEVNDDPCHRKFRRPEQSNSDENLRLLEEVCPESGKIVGRSRFHCYSFTVANDDLAESQNSLGSRWKPIAKAKITLAVELGAASSIRPGLFSIGLPTEKPTGSRVWIDGPFYGDINRKQIDFSKSFNSLLLREAATALPSFLKSIHPTTTIERSLSALGVLDFGSRDAELAEHIFPAEDASEDSETLLTAISAIPFVRSLLHEENGNASGLCLPKVRRALRTSSGEQCQFLSDQRLATHFAFAGDGYYLESKSEELLKRVAASFGGGAAPTLDELTSVCEKLVAEIVTTATDNTHAAQELRGLYEDLGELFPHDFQREKFFNRRILLDQDGIIRTTGSKNPAVFEPRPASKEKDLSSAIQDEVPRLLKTRIVFLHKHSVERLPASKGISRSARFLRGITPPFVQTFETRDLVNSLARVSGKSHFSDSDGKEVLQWALKLWQSTDRPSFGSDVLWHQLRVPVRSDGSGHILWKPARQVYFSTGWDGDTGELLERALARKNRRGESRYFILNPSDFIDVVGKPPGQESFEASFQIWDKFLRTTLRVQRSPRPFSSSAKKAKTRRNAFRCWGKNYRLLARQGLSNLVDLPQVAWEYYLDRLQELTYQEVGGLIQGEKEFEIDRFDWLDGFTEITPTQSLAYARLVSRAFDRYEPHLTCHIERLDSQVRSEIPSTLDALLRTASWLPVEQKGCDTKVGCSTEALLVNAADLSRNTSIPSPCDLLPHVPAQLAVEQNVETLAARIGLAHFDTLEMDGFLKWIGWLAEHTSDPATPLERHLWNEMIRRAARLAREGDLDNSSFTVDPKWKHILAEIPSEASRSHLGLWSPKDDSGENAGPLYLPDEHVLANQVAGRLPIAAVGKCPEDVVAFLQMQFGARAIRKVSELTLVPKASDVDFASLDPSRLELLREIAPWLIRSILAVLAYGRQEQMNIDGKEFRGYIARLSQLQVCEVHDLSVEIAEAPGVLLTGEAFAWPEKKMIIVDSGHRGNCRPLFNSLGDYLDVRDLSQAALWHLGNLAHNGLETRPSSEDIRSTLLRFLGSDEWTRLEQRLSAEQFFVVSRLLPALLAITPTSDVSDDYSAIRFQEAFVSGESQTVLAAWAEMYGSYPAPGHLQELMLDAVSDIPTEELAKRAFDAWKVDIPAWNEKAAEFCVEAGNIQNTFAEKMLANVQDELLPIALSLLRKRLVESNLQHRYRAIKECAEGELAVPEEAKETWEPSDRILAQPLAHAVSGTAFGEELPDWAASILPGVGESRETVVARLRKCGLSIRDNERECFESNLHLVNDIVDQLQLIGLALWDLNHGYGEIPEALFTKVPRQPISQELLQPIDSLLDFQFQDEQAAFAWSRKWWDLTGLDKSVRPLPKAASVKEVASVWSIHDAAIKARCYQATQLQRPGPKSRLRPASARCLEQLAWGESALPTDTTEKGLESLIVDYMVSAEGGWIKGQPADYDRAYAVDLAQMTLFIKATQEPLVEAFDLENDSPTRRKFLARLQGEITKRGTIDVLRSGVMHGPHDLDLFYGTPTPGNTQAEERFASNRFSVTRQLRYSLDETQLSLDFGLFINGLPIATFELKNSLTKQTVEDAVWQYKKDRDSRELLFAFGRCVAHFAVDDHEVRFCTQLKGKASWFLPFNLGYNDGAGNPPNPAGLKTDYLWKRVLTPAGLTNILENYAQVVDSKDEKTGKKKRVQIWPRYHQLEVVRKLLDHAGEHGVGQR